MINKTQIRAAIQRRLRNRRFWRDSSLLMLANVAGIVLGLIRTPAMTWLLPKDEVGMLGVVAAWQAVLVFLTWPSGLNVSAYHFVTKGYPSAFIEYVKHQLRASLLSVVGFGVSAGYWWWQGEVVLAALFVVGGVSFPMTAVLAACAGMLGAQEKFVSLFWYRIGQYLAGFSGFLLLLASMWWVSRGVTFYATNQIVLGILHLGFTGWLVGQIRRAKTPTMPPEERQEMMRYGKHLTGINAVSMVQNRTDQFLVATFLPLAVMADYSIGLLVYEQLKRLWTTYFAIRYPPLVRLNVALRRRRIIIEGSILWMGFIGVGIGLAALLAVLVPILLPATYISSLGYINWLMATFIIGVPGFLAEIYFRTEQDERHQYLLRGIAAVFNVTLPAILIIVLGAYGVVIGRFLSNVVMSVVGMWLFFWQTRRSSSG